MIQGDDALRMVAKKCIPSTDKKEMGEVVVQ